MSVCPQPSASIILSQVGPFMPVIGGLLQLQIMELFLACLYSCWIIVVSILGLHMLYARFNLRMVVDTMDVRQVYAPLLSICSMGNNIWL